MGKTMRRGSEQQVRRFRQMDRVIRALNPRCGKWVLRFTARGEAWTVMGSPRMFRWKRVSAPAESAEDQVAVETREEEQVVAPETNEEEQSAAESDGEDGNGSDGGEVQEQELDDEGAEEDESSIGTSGTRDGDREHVDDAMIRASMWRKLDEWARTALQPRIGEERLSSRRHACVLLESFRTFLHADKTRDWQCIRRQISAETLAHWLAIKIDVYQWGFQSVYYPYEYGCHVAVWENLSVSVLPFVFEGVEDMN